MSTVKLPTESGMAHTDELTPSSSISSKPTRTASRTQHPRRGVCCNPVKDRLNIPGTRWSLTGEAIPRYAPSLDNGDFEDYGASISSVNTNAPIQSATRAN